MDRLSALFTRFAPTARVFHTGLLCGNASFDPTDGVGYLHLLRRGELSVHSEGTAAFTLDEPSALFYPRACGHQLLPVNGAELFCASLVLGSGDHNPLVHALPRVVVLPLQDMPTLQATFELLFTEGLSARCGRQAALDALDHRAGAAQGVRAGQGRDGGIIRRSAPPGSRRPYGDVAEWSKALPC